MSYVVYKGRVPRVYVHWEDCWKQVNRFKGNSYKGYTTMAEVEARWRNHLREERRTTFFSVTTAVLLTAVIAVVVYFIVP
jgi:viroplasmin and RNaseH domain-containing protein